MIATTIREAADLSGRISYPALAVLMVGGRPHFPELPGTADELRTYASRALSEVADAHIVVTGEDGEAPRPAES